jgi:hypothetical protein
MSAIADVIRARVEREVNKSLTASVAEIREIVGTRVNYKKLLEQEIDSRATYFVRSEVSSRLTIADFRKEVSREIDLNEKIVSAVKRQDVDTIIKEVLEDDAWLREVIYDLTYDALADYVKKVAEDAVEAHLDAQKEV